MSLSDTRPTIDSPIRDTLTARAARWQAAADDCRGQAARLTRARAIVFWIGLAGLVVAWMAWLPAWVGYGLAAAALVAWIVLVTRQNRIDLAQARAEQRVRANRLAIARLDRTWGLLPLPSYDVPPEHRATADDLNLFGPRSLFQLLCHASTPDGVRQLGDWLLHGGSREEVRRREAAAIELVPEIDLRQELEVRARLLAAGDTGPERLVEWAESPQEIVAQRWVWLARIAAAVTLVLLVGTMFELWPVDAGWALFSLMMIVNIVLTAIFIPRIHDTYRAISSRHDEVNQYRELFETMRSMPLPPESRPPGSAPRNATPTQLQQLHAAVTDESSDACARLDELSDIMNLADIRRAVILYLPLQVLGLWDFHVADRLARWKRRHGRHTRGWFAALGQFEALCSLASLAGLHADWCFATVEEGESPRVRGEQLGHPLLPPAACVRNDVTLGPPGTLLLVTGSNMSGKSTLLRSVGANVFLAQAGAPVCAAAFSLPRLRVLTSMRIQDSLADGVSFFLAELQRLKSIVDAARAVQADPELSLLYLLDEILQGTNSAERLVAVQTVIARLLEVGAIGAVSTHDLKLATVEPVSSAAEIVHFREQLGHGPDEPEMTFDYQLHPGIATSTNALRLLKMIGLGEETSEISVDSSDTSR